jgi:hypothetical protein
VAANDIIGEEILAGLGYTEAEIEKLWRGEKVI